jgi:predicted nucleotidyltransferase
MKLELEEMLQRKIDLVSSRAISKYILPFVDRDKRLIYEK